VSQGQLKQRELQEITENTILVEGDDDRAIIDKLCKKRKITIPNQTILVPNEFSEKIGGGFRGILKTIEEFHLNSSYHKVKKLLILCDANNEGASKRFSRIKKCLKEQKNIHFSIPKTLGTLSPLRPNTVSVGIFIFPNNKDKGTLETLCLKTLKEQKRLQMANYYLQALRKNNLLKTPNHRLDKARLHAYLAASKEPNIHIRGALKNQEIDLNSNHYDQLVNFLRSLTDST